MQVHVIHEIDCSVERIDPAVVEAFLDTELSDDPMLADSICAMADAMSAELHPRGVYKLFNPAICTLPPKYTEPAIKLVGTLAVLYGSAAYERMSEAEHTAMAVSTIGTDEEIARLRERLVKSDMDALLFDACLEAMASLAGGQARRGRRRRRPRARPAPRQHLGDRRRGLPPHHEHDARLLHPDREAPEAHRRRGRHAVGSLEHLGRHRPVQRDPEEAPRLRLLPQRAHLHHPQDRHDLPRPPHPQEGKAHPFR